MSQERVGQEARQGTTPETGELDRVKEWRPVFYKLAWLGFSYPNREFVEELVSGKFTEGMQEVSRVLEFDLPEDLEPEELDYGEESVKPFFQKLETEYVRLFISSTGGPLVYPYASYYLNDEIRGKAAREIVEEYSGNGFSKSDEYQGEPDHISVLLEYMFKLSHNPSDCGFGYHKDFYDKYLEPWHGQFTDSVVEKSAVGFYRTLAGWVNKGLKADRKVLDELTDGPTEG